MTIQQLARELSDNTYDLELADGGSRWVLKNDAPEWMRDVCRKVHDDGKIPPDDTTYEYIVNALDLLQDLNHDADEATAHERVDELEPDVYTSDITAWLAKSNTHVGWVTEAIENYNPRDGFEALEIAQMLHKQEVGHALVDALVDYQKTL